MIVNVKFFAGLRDLLPAEPSPYPAEMPLEATVGELLDHFQVPPDKPKIILVNGIHADRDHTLKEGDTLAVFPPVAGG